MSSSFGDLVSWTVFTWYFWIMLEQRFESVPVFHPTFSFISRVVNHVATRWQPWTTLVTLFDRRTHWGAIILSQFSIQYVRRRIHFSYVKWRQILLLSCLYNNWPCMSRFMENSFELLMWVVIEGWFGPLWCLVSA